MAVCLCGSRNRETWHAIWPLQMTYYKTWKRTVGQASGKSSTFHASYTGIPIRRLLAVPRLIKEVKQAIVGGGHSGGVKGEKAAEEVKKYGHVLC